MFRSIIFFLLLAIFLPAINAQESLDTEIGAHIEWFGTGVPPINVEEADRKITTVLSKDGDGAAVFIPPADQDYNLVVETPNGEIIAERPHPEGFQAIFYYNQLGYDHIVRCQIIKGQAVFRSITGDERPIRSGDTVDITIPKEGEASVAPSKEDWVKELEDANKIKKQPEPEPEPEPEPAPVDLEPEPDPGLLESEEVVDNNRSEKYQNMAQVHKKDFKSFAEFFGPRQVASFEFVFQPSLEAEFVNNAVQDDIDQIGGRIRFNHQFNLNRNMQLGIGLKYDHYHINANDFSDQVNGGEDFRLGAYDLPLSFTYTTDRLLINATFEAQWHTDYQEFEWRNAMYEAFFRVGYMLTPDLYVEAGVWAYDRFDAVQFVPLVGIEWRPSQEFTFELKIPQYFKATYWFLSDTNWFLYGERDYNQFRTRIEDTSVAQEVIFESFNIGIGIEHFIMPGMSIHAVVGGTVEGEFKVDQQEDADLGSGLFLKVGFNINSNFFAAN